MSFSSSVVLSAKKAGILDDVCRQLAELAPTTATGGEWPARQLRLLADAGMLAWGFPEEFGGQTLNDIETLHVYELLAAACVTTAFILTQRSAACQRIAGCDNQPLKSRLLPALARGDRFATVGISHLTTSRQHLAQPSVAASENDAGFTLTGSVPWVTGAAFADHLVTGGTLADGRQVLLAIERSQPGVAIDPALQLLALSASHTASQRLSDVIVPRNALIAGPVQQVMKHTAGGGAGSLTTSALALGLTRRVLESMFAEAARRHDLLPICEALQSEWSETATQMYAAAGGTSGGGVPGGEMVRQQANSLVLRAAQAFLAASKGAGFVTGHPAERAVREAMFFLVWSCPQPVVSAALREFACVLD